MSIFIVTMAWPWQNGWSEGCKVCVTKGQSQTEARHWDWRWTGIKLGFAGEERDVERGKLLWTQISYSHWTLSHLSTFGICLHNYMLIIHGSGRVILSTASEVSTSSEVLKCPTPPTSTLCPPDILTWQIQVTSVAKAQCIRILNDCVQTAPLYLTKGV